MCVCVSVGVSVWYSIFSNIVHLFTQKLHEYSLEFYKRDSFCNQLFCFLVNKLRSEVNDTIYIDE